MKFTQTVSIVLLCVLGSGALVGCMPVNKVKRTLALNDLHIQASVAESRGDDTEAYELWTEYVDRRPQSVMAEYRLGMVETRLGKFDQAAGHLRVAHDLKPGNIEYIDALANALLLAGRTDSMMKMLRETLEEGESGSGYLRLARYAQDAGQMDEAREALILAVVHDQGDSVIPYLAMADFARGINDVDSEITHLRYALWFDVSNAPVLERLAGLGMISGPSLAIDPR